MKEKAKNAVKQYIRGELLRTRSILGLSREEMGFKMGITEWGYKDLERGKFCCSLIPLLLFVNHCCLDPDTFWEGLKEAAKLDEWQDLV